MKLSIALVVAWMLALCACTGDANAPASAPAAEPAAEPAAATPAAPVDTDMPAEGDMPQAEAPAADVPPPADDAPAGASDAPSPPAIAVGEPNPGAPGVVDRSCRTDADCAVKDVGSCCGYRPACVNTASPTFPDQVKAKCAQDGRVGICGFPSITGCKCTAGQCEGTGAEIGEKIQ
jgi:hypothetical protein